jgi:hypothetical protein
MDVIDFQDSEIVSIEISMQVYKPVPLRKKNLS